MKSDNVKKGIERAPHRSLFKAMGYTEEELSKPLVGIANPVNDIIPGHVELNRIVDAVKAGVYMAGGTPIGFRNYWCLRWDSHESHRNEIFASQSRIDCRLD